MTKRKKSTTTPSLSTANEKGREAVSKDEEFTLKNMIKEQLATHLRKNKIKDDTTAMLTSLLEEYLSCCIVLGYDFEGQPTTIISVNNQQDADALGTQLQRFITNSTGYGPPPGRLEPPGRFEPPIH